MKTSHSSLSMHAEKSEVTFIDERSSDDSEIETKAGKSSL